MFSKILVSALLSFSCFCAMGADQAATLAPVPPSPALTQQYRQITPEELSGNIIKMVSKQWMLITAGQPDKFNSMTAGWGGIGVLWSKPVVFIAVRDTRYTYQFLERENYFTLTFFDEKYRAQLHMFGTKSGRNVDKLKESGFTAINTGKGMAYEEAKLIIACKKIYGDKLEATNASNLEPNPWFFKGAGYHKLYFGEIVGIWIKK